MAGKAEIMLTPEHVTDAHEGFAVWNAEWSPSGKMLASCGSDCAVRLWHLREADLLLELTHVLDGVHSRSARRVSWHPDGNALASASFDGTTAIWSIHHNEWSCIATLEGHENEVKGVACSPSGTLLATCGRDKSVWIWEMQGLSEFECVSVMNDHTQDVKAVVWHPRMDVLVSASYDNTIKSWEEEPDGDDWYCSSTLPRHGDEGHNSTVWDVAFHPHGECFVSGSDDGSILSWRSPFKGRWERSECVFSGGTRPVFGVSWSKHGFVCSGSADNAVRLHSLDNDMSVWFVSAIDAKTHAQDVNSVRVNPVFPNLLSSASDDGTICLWLVSYKE